MIFLCRDLFLCVFLEWFFILIHVHSHLPEGSWLSQCLLPLVWCWGRNLLNLHLYFIAGNRNPEGLDRFNLFMYFIKHLVFVNSIYCIGIWISQKTYLANFTKMNFVFLSDLVSYHLLTCIVSAKENDFFFRWDIVTHSSYRACFFLLEVIKYLKQLSEALFFSWGKSSYYVFSAFHQA